MNYRLLGESVGSVIGVLILLLIGYSLVNQKKAKQLTSY